MYNFTQEELDLIEARKNACLAQMEIPSNLSGLYCPAKFDGWTCWPDTPAGTTANQSCIPIISFDPNRKVFHECEANGSWEYNLLFQKPWVNYSTCINMDDYNFRLQVNLIYSIGYGVSLVALLLSLALFTYFKSLRCARITVHMNLFASFAANNLLWLLWYNIVVNDEEVLSQNKLWCRILHVFLYSFLISNYSWMLCEGIYLHTVLVSAFISERLLLRYMLLLGWGTPLLTALIYVPVRSILGTTPDELERCWMEESRFHVLVIPVVITVTLNVIFLVNIVRVLLIKLRRGPANSGASGTSLQALRATMLLVPLLGLNYLLTPFRPARYHPWEYVYEVVSAVTASLQGLCVAILFCFCNGEVIAQVKRKWRNIMFRPRANSCTVTTVSFVRSSYPANGEEKV